MATSVIQSEGVVVTPNPSVSAVIPVWNREKDLKACLNSLALQQDVSVEVIVVDDGSSDGSVQMVRENFPSAVLVCSEGSGVGPAHRRNQGVLASHGDYILQLDSDITFEDPRAISNMVAILSQREEVGSVGGEIAAHVKDYDHVHALRFDHMDRPQRISANCQDELDCDYLATLCCMMRQRDIRALGGYDPYGEYGGEDADLGYRFKKAGFRNIARFDCAALHHASQTGRHIDDSYRFCLAWWRFVIKHRGVSTFALRLGWYLFRLCGAVLLLPWVCLRQEHPLKQLSILSVVMKSASANMRRLRSIIRMRTVNFLSPEEMRRFEEWKQLGK